MPAHTWAPPRPLLPLYQQLRDRRIATGLSQEAVAERIGYALRSFQAWETGQNNPKPGSLVKWAEALGLEIQLVEKTS